MSSSSRFRLTRIAIRDFRGIDALDLTIPEDDDDRGGALVLAGENGCGKTSVLEAILLLFGRLDLMPSDTAPARELVRQGAKDFRLEAHSEQPHLSWSVTAGGVEQLDRLLREAGRDGTLFGSPIPRVAHERAMRRILPVDVSSPPVTLFSIEYFSARREPEDLGDVGDAHSRHGTREERRLAELARRLANVFARSRRNRTFERIERYMRAFLGAQWSLDVIFRDASEGSDPIVVARDGDLPEGPDGEPLTFDAIREAAKSGAAMPKVVPIDRLSSGQMALLSLAYPFVFGDRPVDLALLDEPEQHMHPIWQRALVPALRELSPTTRFIVATHSPFVAQSASEDGLFVLTPGADRSISVARPFQSVKGWRADAMLTSPLFGLSDTVDLYTERLVAEYRGLASRRAFESLTDEEQKRLDALETERSRALISPGETHADFERRQRADAFVDDVVKRLDDRKAG